MDRTSELYSLAPIFSSIESKERQSLLDNDFLTKSLHYVQLIDKFQNSLKLKNRRPSTEARDELDVLERGRKQLEEINQIEGLQEISSDFNLHRNLLLDYIKFLEASFLQLLTETQQTSSKSDPLKRFFGNYSSSKNSYRVKEVISSRENIESKAYDKKTHFPKPELFSKVTAEQQFQILETRNSRRCSRIAKYGNFDGRIHSKTKLYVRVNL
eukprot:GHVP01021231.1.p1 GENE.GHVP01021231.1~~GHVP01021231.1.p1  ORF type:complete len:213 (+),score=42.63 GHVP01021231.1:37-675(+)